MTPVETSPSSTTKVSTHVFNLVCFVLATLTAMIGYQIHGSGGWAVVDWLLWPFVWMKWLICQEVTLTIIKETFSFFLQ